MRACTTDLPLKNQRRFNLGNDMPVYTFTTHIFKHRHPRLDWGYLHRLQHSHPRLDRGSLRRPSTVIPGLTGDLRTTVSFPGP